MAEKARASGGAPDGSEVRGRGGRKAKHPSGVRGPKEQRNCADPDSRITEQTSAKASVQAYSAQRRPPRHG